MSDQLLIENLRILIATLETRKTKLDAQIETEQTRLAGEVTRETAFAWWDVATSLRDLRDILNHNLAPLQSAEDAAKKKYDDRLREGHRTPIWEALPDLMRQELVFREITKVDVANVH